MPHRFVRAIEPIVQHGLRELQAGVPLGHTMREVALMSALVGSGVSPREAITQVEQQEEELLGRPRGEEFEYGPFGWMGPGFGKGAGVPYGMATPYGKGYDTGMPYGKGAGMGMPYGKGAGMPYGKGMGMPYGKGYDMGMPYGKGGAYGLGAGMGMYDTSMYALPPDTTAGE